MEHLRVQWRKTASSGTYWRVHSKSRPFLISDAFSVPMSSFGDRDKTNRQARPGFSCMANPWHLWVYCMAMGWLADGYVQGSDVIEFSGRPITKGDFTDLGVPESAIEWLWDGGRGVDREPLVMPDMRTVNKQSWSSFEKMLLSTPLPPGPQSSDVRFNGDLDSWSDLAEILHERKGRYAKESGPVIDFLIGKFILGGIGRMASIIPATTSANGPFRTVVNVEQGDRGIYVERLECGHTGKTGWKAEWLGTTVDGKPSKRRCYDCLSSEHKYWLNDHPKGLGHECSDGCILPVRKTSMLTTAAMKEGTETYVGPFRLVYTTVDKGETKPRHVITAYVGSTKAGEMEWYGRTGEIYGIEVEPEYRRQGLATAMWDFAQDAPKKPQHSNQRTNDGEAWSKSVGGPRPRRLHASSGAQIEAWSDPGYELARGGWASNVSAVARIGGQPVGFLYADTVDRGGSIEKIWVHPDHRRKGIATEMLRAAERQVGFKIDHGHELSQSGAAWAEQVSGRPARPTYRGDGEFGYMIDQFDRESPSKRGR